jgi:tetratricopeptide (TPR) repeat protein
VNQEVRSPISGDWRRDWWLQKPQVRGRRGSSPVARRLLQAERMARLDNTAVWFERGEDDAAMAETPSTGEPRHIPTMGWVGGTVALTAVLFGAAVLHHAHASRLIDEPLASPGLAAAVTAAAPLPQPSPAPVSASPASRAPASASPAPGLPASTPPVRPQPASTSPVRPQPASTSAADKLLRRGRPAAALAAYQQTLAHNPNDVRALRGACLSLSRLGRPNDAARVCRRALDRAPADLETRRALATIYYNGGAYKWSAAEWRRVIEQSPRDVRARRALRNAEARAQKG